MVNQQYSGPIKTSIRHVPVFFSPIILQCIGEKWFFAKIGPMTVVKMYQLLQDIVQTEKPIDSIQ